MPSLNKIEANRRNAQASTGPRSPEGKAAVARNAITHGLRAKKHLLYFERYADFDKVCRDLEAEWQPSTPTEANLVEQMAVAQAKLVRLESNLSAAFYQSYAMKAAACEEEFTDPDGTVRTLDFIDDREFEVQRLINGVSQHIARVERAWHKALDALQRLQDRRRKQVTNKPAPAGEPARSPSPEESAPHEETPAAVAAPESAPDGPIIHEMSARNDEQSHRRGEQFPRKRVGSSSSGGSDAIESCHPTP